MFFTLWHLQMADGVGKRLFALSLQKTILTRLPHSYAGIQALRAAAQSRIKKPLAGERSATLAAFGYGPVSSIKH